MSITKVGINDLSEVSHDGIVKILEFREGVKLNRYWESKEPIYNILSPLELFDLLIRQELVKMTEKYLSDNFTEIHV